ncbi:MBL fold metallo-hydrolase [Crocosphaera sp. UHCC 0190]|uniref:MBL fold metallo-hydrolase n=1 Tax=Crocosphaera sp. UHCC 0190 TaxID=3110246 RepID=UPI002B1EB5BE|nr:MBL fold metallo-hydrolase [Crocosphaera sp. UHCC 0190]MEA5511219.1 MBL fold metallo-hydrolase [Crocosphaera sp. UHCC 0190]
MLFRQLFDGESSTYTYLIADRTLKEALLVDPVLEQVPRDRQLLQELGLTLKYCLETHIHADHITGTGKLRELTGCLGIVPENAKIACADRFLRDGETLKLGNIVIEAIATPGHTDSHLAYLVNQTAVLTGDALFIRGCGRTDFQSGDAGTLYDSVTQGLFTLPEETFVYPGHDYRGQTVSTIGEEKQWNPRFLGRDRSQFITFMNNLNLPNPKKMMEAVPANQSCGKIAM